MNNIKKNFVAYDYLDISVPADDVSFYLDAYENFGWEADEKTSFDPTLGKVHIFFRRDRKIINKQELTRLQRNFGSCINEVNALEASKTSTARMAALTIGIIGTAFMAGSVFAVTATPPLIILSIILGIPGILGWILPYFVYKKVVASRTRKIAPLVEEKMDELYEICEKGHRLL